jgi:hypothetical protein
MGGGDMKRMAFALLLALTALTATIVAWTTPSMADSSDSSVSTTEAP